MLIFPLVSSPLSFFLPNRGDLVFFFKLTCPEKFSVFHSHWGWPQQSCQLDPALPKHFVWTTSKSCCCFSQTISHRQLFWFFCYLCVCCYKSLVGFLILFASSTPSFLIFRKNHFFFFFSPNNFAPQKQNFPPRMITGPKVLLICSLWSFSHLLHPHLLFLHFFSPYHYMKSTLHYRPILRAASAMVNCSQNMAI